MYGISFKKVNKTRNVDVYCVCYGWSEWGEGSYSASNSNADVNIK